MKHDKQTLVSGLSFSRLLILFLEVYPFLNPNSLDENFTSLDFYDNCCSLLDIMELNTLHKISIFCLLNVFVILRIIKNINTLI